MMDVVSSVASRIHRLDLTPPLFFLLLLQLSGDSHGFFVSLPLSNTGREIIFHNLQDLLQEGMVLLLGLLFHLEVRKFLFELINPGENVQVFLSDLGLFFLLKG